MAFDFGAGLGLRATGLGCLDGVSGNRAREVAVDGRLGAIGLSGCGRGRFGGVGGLKPSIETVVALEAMVGVLLSSEG